MLQQIGRHEVRHRDGPLLVRLRRSKSVAVELELPPAPPCRSLLRCRAGGSPLPPSPPTGWSLRGHQGDGLTQQRPQQAWPCRPHPMRRAISTKRAAREVAGLLGALVFVAVCLWVVTRLPEPWQLRAVTASLALDDPAPPPAVEPATHPRRPSAHCHIPLPSSSLNGASTPN